MLMNLEPHGMNGTEEPIRARGLADRLRRVGQRVTPQRLVILGALKPGEHLAADEVFARVEPLLPGVNRSTVYRTLELFRDLGLVSMTDLGGGARQFELIDDLHHQLICHRCGGSAARRHPRSLRICAGHRSLGDFRFLLRLHPRDGYSRGWPER
jgi:Fe2+ or Zn2+ uptake regulation protein